MFELCARLEAQKTPFVVCTLLSTRGHAPQDPGAKAVFTREGLVGGTVGGGRIEAKCQAVAQEILETAPTKPRLHQWNLQRDVGMSCGGEVEVLFEDFRPHPWKVVIFGAGHVAQALVRTLLPLPCEILCVDPREEWVGRLPEAPNLEARAEADLPSVRVEASDFVVVMTQGHKTDLPVLDSVLRGPYPRYLGVIGSRVKGIKLRKELEELGHDPSRLHCPMGLELGSNNPAEIALSIAAQLVQVRDKENRP